MKNILPVLMLLLTFSLFAGGEQESGETVIGAPMAIFADKFLSYLYDAIRAFDEEQEDLRIVLTDANNDPKKQLNDVDNFIVDGVDALLTIPVNLEMLPVIGRKAKAAGVPVVVLNRLGNDQQMKDITSYVGSQEIEAGRIQGKEAARLLGGRGEVAILMGVLGHTAQIYRTAGVEEVFADYPDIKVVARQTANWDRAEGLAVAQDWLQAYPNLKGIISNNDEAAIGAVLAARKAGKSDEDLVIIGVDATPDAREFLGKGLDATVLQDAVAQGRVGAETAYRAAKGETVEKRVWIPFQLVTP